MNSESKGAIGLIKLDCMLCRHRYLFQNYFFSGQIILKNTLQYSRSN